MVTVVDEGGVRPRICVGQSSKIELGYCCILQLEPGKQVACRYVSRCRCCREDAQRHCDQCCSHMGFPANRLSTRSQDDLYTPPPAFCAAPAAESVDRDRGPAHRDLGHHDDAPERNSSAPALLPQWIIGVLDDQEVLQKMNSRGVNTDAVYDELRRIEGEVQGERRLAEQEALLADLRRQNDDTGKVREELDDWRATTQSRARATAAPVSASPVGNEPTSDMAQRQRKLRRSSAAMAARSLPARRIALQPSR